MHAPKAHNNERTEMSMDMTQISLGGFTLLKSV